MFRMKKKTEIAHKITLKSKIEKMKCLLGLVPKYLYVLPCICTYVCMYMCVALGPRLPWLRVWVWERDEWRKLLKNTFGFGTPAKQDKNACFFVQCMYVRMYIHNCKLRSCAWHKRLHFAVAFKKLAQQTKSKKVFFLHKHK